MTRDYSSTARLKHNEDKVLAAELNAGPDDDAKLGVVVLSADKVAKPINEKAELKQALIGMGSKIYRLKKQSMQAKALKQSGSSLKLNQI